MKTTCFLDSSTQNHAESFGIFLKNSVLDPKCVKLNQKSDIWAHMGPARALEENVGPARALERREKFRKSAPLFLNAFLWTNVFFGLRMHFYEQMSFLVSKPCCLSFSTQNHWESSRNRTKSRKYGPIWTHVGPARALEESVGPARALEEREKFRKNAPLLFSTHF